MPGNHGVKVANASLYGVKIYTAATPTTSTGYDRTQMKLMFCCVGTTKGAEVHGDYHVYPDPRNVVPVFLCQYKSKPYSLYSLNTIGGRSDGELFEISTNPTQLIAQASKESNVASSSSAADPYGVPAGKKMTTHEKKLLRQKRQQLGLSKISM